MSTDNINKIFRNIYRYSTCENYQNYITIVNNKAFIFAPPKITGGFEIYLDADKDIVRCFEWINNKYANGVLYEDINTKAVWNDIKKAYDRVKAVADWGLSENDDVKQSLSEWNQRITDLEDCGISRDYRDGDYLRNELEMLNFVAPRKEEEEDEGEC